MSLPFFNRYDMTLECRKNETFGQSDTGKPVPNSSASVFFVVIVLQTDLAFSGSLGCCRFAKLETMRDKQVPEDVRTRKHYLAMTAAVLEPELGLSPRMVLLFQLL